MSSPPHIIAPRIIAIDGTAASGKGTLARRMGAALGFAVLDTGLLYRAVGLAYLTRCPDADQSDIAISFARDLKPDDLGNPDLRGALAGRGASIVGAIGPVRAALLDFQRGFPARSGKPGAILDGRDIGTVIFPGADIKFYIDAALDVRAARRHRELLEKGEDITFETVRDDFKIRDARDAGRADAPMKPADDALLIDTTTLDADATYACAMDHWRQKVQAGKLL